MNGEFIKWNDTKCHVITQGLHYASAVFEGEELIEVRFLNLKNTQKGYLDPEVLVA